MRNLILVLTTLVLVIVATQAKHRNKVKRFGESFTPIQDFLAQQQQQRALSDEFSTSPKSNIPFAPSSMNFIQQNDDATQEIPLGPLVQSDMEKPADGEVHLKDLLSFIRKTNIPEDPFTNGDSHFTNGDSRFTNGDPQSAASDLLSSADRSIEQQLLINNQPLRRFNVPSSVSDQRRFRIPSLQERMNSARILNPMKRFFLQQNIPALFAEKRFPSQIAGNYERNTIPHSPDQLATFNKMAALRSQIPKSLQPIHLTSNTAGLKLMLRSTIPEPAANANQLRSLLTKPKKRIDPYEGLKQAIIKKAATDTRPVSSFVMKSKRNIIANTTVPDDTTNENMPGIQTATIEDRKQESRPDPYEDLKRAISNKEEEQHDLEEDTRTEELNIPNDGEQQKDKQGDDVTGEERSNIYRNAISTIYPNSYEDSGRRTEIPGITIEHTTVPNEEKLTEHVRKDKIPDSDGNKRLMVQDANNEPETKRSVVVNPPLSWETKRSNYPIEGQARVFVGPDQQLSAPVLSATNSAQLDTDSQFITKSDVPLTQSYLSKPQVNTVAAYQPPVANYMTSDDTAVQMQSITTNDEQGDATSSAENNSTLPTGEELERTKIQREMHLIGQLQEMKKSTIPNQYQYKNLPHQTPANGAYPMTALQIASTGSTEEQETKKKTDVLSSSSFHDSTPLMLRKHPAEGIRESIPEPPFIPHKQIMMKKSAIPTLQKENTETNFPQQFVQANEQSTYQQPLYIPNNGFYPQYGTNTLIPKQATTEEYAFAKKSVIPNTHKGNEPSYVTEDENETQDKQNDNLLTQEVDVQQSPEPKPEPEKTEDGARKDIISPHSNIPSDSFPLQLRILPPL